VNREAEGYLRLKIFCIFDSDWGGQTDEENFRIENFKLSPIKAIHGLEADRFNLFVNNMVDTGPSV
jgi:hypothetical protein